MYQVYGDITNHFLKIELKVGVRIKIMGRRLAGNLIRCLQKSS